MAAMTTPAEERKPDPRVGQVLLSQYRIDALLGEGGMGTGYRGEQLSVRRPVAIKLISGKIAEDPECVRRFRREAEAMAKLRHPNTVRLYDFGVADQVLFMVMELLEGRDLSEELVRRQRLAPIEALAITRQVLEALAEAHAMGIVHRDLKPANVYLSQVHGGRVMAKVMDFGIAGIEWSANNTKLTVQGAVMGTPAYMSPEQAQGEAVDRRSDLYSLGIVLYEMVVGKPPFDADSAVSLLLAHVNTAPPRLVDAAPDLAEMRGLQELLDGLLHKDRAERPNSAEAALDQVDALLRQLGDTSGSARHVAQAAKSGHPAGRVSSPAQPAVRGTALGKMVVVARQHRAGCARWVRAPTEQ
jgi:serine/threonine protein kinase